MTLHTCTFTGVDANTDLSSAADLAKDHPTTEFGILFSRTRAGIENRYPVDVMAIAARLRDRNPDIKLALHVCGRAVFELVSGSPKMLETAGFFDRVQLNFALGRVPFETAQLGAWIADFGRPVITQHNQANAALVDIIAAPNHQVLFDTSGGEGLRPNGGWPLAPGHKAAGFAGGIGPGTVVEDMATITASNPGVDYWIDMEGKIRTDDLFDLRLCEDVAMKVSQVNSSNPSAKSFTATP